MEGERVTLTTEQAIAMLPDRDQVHVACNPAASVILGADWDKETVVEKIKKHGAELSGPEATKLGHGMAFCDENGWWFVETRKEAA